MSGKKKNGNEDKSIKTLILVTALIQLMQALINLINKLLE